MEAEREVAPSFVVALLEERWPVRRFVEFLADAVAQLDGIIGCRFSVLSEGNWCAERMRICGLSILSRMHKLSRSPRIARSGTAHSHAKWSAWSRRQISHLAFTPGVRLIAYGFGQPLQPIDGSNPVGVSIRRRLRAISKDDRYNVHSDIHVST